VRFAWDSVRSAGFDRHFKAYQMVEVLTGGSMYFSLSSLLLPAQLHNMIHRLVDTNTYRTKRLCERRSWHTNLLMRRDTVSVSNSESRIGTSNSPTLTRGHT